MGLSFVESLRHLAQKYSIDIPELEQSSPDWKKYRNEQDLYQIMAEAQAFFTRELFQPQGLEARNYLLGRGFKEDELRQWGFGLTPLEGFGLTRYLRQRGYSESQLVELSLTTPAQDATRRPYDFFRHRIMIPIREVQGRIVAFGGRALDLGKDPAKYKNSRETRLFNKSEILFGLHEARHHIRAKGRVIVVEGYMDALRLWSAGFPETVACMGTALTAVHMQRLKALTGLVILVFDGDQAGQRATLKAVDIALSEPSVIVRAVRLPEGLDPDDCVSQKGVEFFENILTESVYLLDFAIREKLSGLYPHAAAALVKDEILPWIAKISDSLLRDSLLVRIASHLGTSREKLAAQLPKPEDQRAARALSQMAQRETLRERPADPKAQKSSQHSVGQGTTSMGGGEDSPRHRAPDTSLSLADLSVAVKDLVAHLYLSTAEDHGSNLQKLRQEVFEAMDFPEVIQFFIEEILRFLASGQAPQSQPLESWQSLANPTLVELRDNIHHKQEAYKTQNRSFQIQRIMLHTKMERIKKTLTALRAEASRLWRRPESKEELEQIMKSIKSMEQDRMEVYRRLHAQEA